MTNNGPITQAGFDIGAMLVFVEGGIKSSLHTVCEAAEHTFAVASRLGGGITTAQADFSTKVANAAQVVASPAGQIVGA